MISKRGVSLPTNAEVDIDSIFQGIIMSLLYMLFLSVIVVASPEQLNDLPSSTVENLKWIIPISNWDNKESYFIKGDIFRMSIDAQTRRKTPNGEEFLALDVFDTPDAKTPVKISLTRDRIYGSNSELLCQKTPTRHPIISNNNMKCEGGGCAPYMYDGPVDINNENLCAHYTTPQSINEGWDYEKDTRGVVMSHLYVTFFDSVTRNCVQRHAVINSPSTLKNAKWTYEFVNGAYIRRVQ